MQGDHPVVELENERQGRDRGVVGADTPALQAGHEVEPAWPAVSIVVCDSVTAPAWRPGRPTRQRDRLGAEALLISARTYRPHNINASAGLRSV
jgi:hypothetical protein